MAGERGRELELMAELRSMFLHCADSEEETLLMSIEFLCGGCEGSGRENAVLVIDS